MASEKDLSKYTEVGNGANTTAVKSEKSDSMDTNELICLAQVYLDEWCNRHDIMSRERIQFALIPLIAILLPWLDSIEGFNLGIIPEKWYPVFPCAGIILALYFMFNSYVDWTRMRAAGDSYRNVIERLPESGYYRFLKKNAVKSKGRNRTHSVGDLLKQMAYKIHLGFLLSILPYAVIIIIALIILIAMWMPME